MSTLQTALVAVNVPVRLTPRSAPRLLALSLLTGVVVEFLLQPVPWGLNLAIAVAVAVAVAAYFARSGEAVLEGEGRWLVAPMLFFAGCLAWRDSATLTAANGAAVFGSVCLATLTSRAGQVRLAGLSQYLLGMLYVVGHAVAGWLPTLRGEIAWRRYRWWSGPSLALARGLAFALPLLLLFGALLSAASADFEALVRGIFAFDAAATARHVLLALAYAWLAGGLFREMLLAPMRAPADRRLSGPRLGIVEAVVVLGLLDVLFLVFVVVQVPYLFGGEQQVATIGYSEYARRGFFELVWAAGLMLPLLLWAHWLIRASEPTGQRVFNALARAMVVLLYVVLASALQRMHFYVVDLGLTELRVQATAFMAWMAIVLGWFLATVLPGERRRFAFGALVSAYCVVGVLNIVNPDALIVRTNATYGHFDAGKKFDDRALASLSADATPAIVDVLPRMAPENALAVSSRLERKYGSARSGDWRSFNWSRWQAAGVIRP